MGGGVGHRGDAAVVGHVEPLVTVGGPGVGTFKTLEQAATAWARGGPKPKGAVDVAPRVMRAADIDDVGDRVEGTGVHVTGLSAHDRRARPADELALDTGRWHPA